MRLGGFLTVLVFVLAVLLLFALLFGTYCFFLLYLPDRIGRWSARSRGERDPGSPPDPPP